MAWHARAGGARTQAMHWHADICALTLHGTVCVQVWSRMRGVHGEGGRGRGRRVVRIGVWCECSGLGAACPCSAHASSPDATRTPPRVRTATRGLYLRLRHPRLGAPSPLRTPSPLAPTRPRPRPLPSPLPFSHRPPHATDPSPRPTAFRTILMQPPPPIAPTLFAPSSRHRPLPSLPAWSTRTARSTTCRARSRRR